MHVLVLATQARIVSLYWDSFKCMRVNFGLSGLIALVFILFVHPLLATQNLSQFCRHSVKSCPVVRLVVVLHSGARKKFKFYQNYPLPIRFENHKRLAATQQCSLGLQLDVLKNRNWNYEFCVNCEKRCDLKIFCHLFSKNQKYMQCECIFVGNIRKIYIVSLSLIKIWIFSHLCIIFSG